MPELFKIETDRVVLSWGSTREKPIPLATGINSPPGRLVVSPKRRGMTFSPETWRADVPAAVCHDLYQTAGPRLYEETDYSVYAQSKTTQPLFLRSRDPLLTRGIVRSDAGRVLHGIVNFGSQVGLASFALQLGSEPECEFEVEVFPSKLDYVSDYQQLLAEVQEILTGLVLEYLRSTFQLGSADRVPHPTQLEWLVLLRHIAEELGQAIDAISLRPRRGLVREAVLVRAERIRRSDSTTRAAIRLGRGAGGLTRLPGLSRVREQLPESRAHDTLDTPEHRWIASSLDAIRRHLAEVRRREVAQDPSPRRDAAIAEMDGLLSLVSRLLKAAPLAAANGLPPPGFASLQLIQASGYREAYRACLILSLGLRLDGGPVNLSLKDISLLYEYWCVLSLIRLVAEETGMAIPVNELLSVEANGLRVRLQRGRQQAVRFPVSAGRRVSVIYNPLFQGAEVLIPQRPDIVVAIEDEGWSFCQDLWKIPSSLVVKPLISPVDQSLVGLV